MADRVLIVGGGPTGLALALVLARWSVPSLIVEAREAPTPRDQSRAIVWMPKGLDLLRQLGLEKAFMIQGVRRLRHAFEADGRTLLEMSFEDLGGRFPFTLQLPQHDSERLLEQAALATGLVEVRRGMTVTTVGQDEGLAWAECANGDRVAASWAVACDGTSGPAREALGVARRWRDYGARSAVADFEMDCDRDPSRSSITLDPGRPWGVFNFAPDRWRLVYRLNEGEDRHEVTSEGFALGLLRARVPGANVRRLLWASAFRLGQGQCTRYRAGRWTLAGDAAHAMGPSAGAGMMVGVIGAWRLGSRLGAALRDGRDPGRAMATYEAEQRRTAARVQRANEAIFRNLAVASPLLAKARNLALRAAGGLPGLPRALTRTEALVGEATPDLPAAAVE